MEGSTHCFVFAPAPVFLCAFANPLCLLSPPCCAAPREPTLPCSGLHCDTLTTPASPGSLYFKSAVRHRARIHKYGCDCSVISGREDHQESVVQLQTAEESVGYPCVRGNPSAALSFPHTAQLCSTASKRGKQTPALDTTKYLYYFIL